MRGLILTVANQKGGVGKTTTTMNLGVAWAKTGLRVLLVDSDPQANLTSYLGVVPGAAPHAEARTLDEAYVAKRVPPARDYILVTSSGVDLIPGEKTLNGIDYYLLSRSDKERVLADFLRPVRDQYDVILIDTPPTMNLLTLNALVASDRVLVPVQAEFFGLEGIVKIRESIAQVRERWNPRLEIAGVLLTQLAPRRRLSQDVRELLATELGTLLLETAIHDNAAVAESAGHGRAVIDYDATSRGAKDYLALARELGARLGLIAPADAQGAPADAEVTS
jgi:chromosome partitioning protein